ncbi:YqkE family protein [Cohnella faecalis]|uniref:DUF3886 domain-containing protein n=1 Tax=Cohnella faecalis TaxID=2315694 RepID=A0A398CMH2_9BACL|nr:YqkE family protein [Cohnella faecalis]RIE03450.1 DUF3886 domain-containing protein [Cohnella faecalis]
MSSKNRRSQPVKAEASDKPATLKDLLSADTLAKLKAHTDQMKQEQLQQAEQKRKKEEEARKEEQKRNENDFAYLLNHSKVKTTKY